jgi:hypothetical protein
MGQLSLVDKGRNMKTKPEYVPLIVVDLCARKGCVPPSARSVPRVTQQLGSGTDERKASNKAEKLCPVNRYNLMTSNGAKGDADYVRLIGVNSR